MVQTVTIHVTMTAASQGVTGHTGPLRRAQGVGHPPVDQHSCGPGVGVRVDRPRREFGLLERTAKHATSKGSTLWVSYETSQFDPLEEGN